MLTTLIGAQIVLEKHNWHVLERRVILTAGHGEEPASRLHGDQSWTQAVL